MGGYCWLKEIVVEYEAVVCQQQLYFVFNVTTVNKRGSRKLGLSRCTQGMLSTWRQHYYLMTFVTCVPYKVVKYNDFIERPLYDILCIFLWHLCRCDQASTFIQLSVYILTASVIDIVNFTAFFFLNHWAKLCPCLSSKISNDFLMQRIGSRGFKCGVFLWPGGNTEHIFGINPKTTFKYQALLQYGGAITNNQIRAALIFRLSRLVSPNCFTPLNTDQLLR